MFHSRNSPNKFPPKENPVCGFLVTKTRRRGVLNSAPRLKIRESFANGINLRARAEGKHEFILFTDWGGYGIIAPDLTN